LVHVCRRWRHVILASPLRLNLTVVCTSKTPTGESLDIWPPFPIAIHSAPCDPPGDIENVVAALGHSDRVTDIRLIFRTRSDLIRSFLRMMMRPFSVLAYLSLGWVGNVEFVLPYGFLDGSAPSLRTLLLERIVFPELPSLLSSTTQLVRLQLSSVPFIGYILPEVMATYLVALPNLQQLDLVEFQPRSLHEFPHTDQSLSTRGVLPSLALLRFKGDNDYLEDLLARIDAPMLKTFSATFSNDIVLFPHLLIFVSSIERLGPPIRVMVDLEFCRVFLKSTPSDSFELAITLENFVEHSLSMICRELLPLLSHVERLELYWAPLRPGIALLPKHFKPWRHLRELFQPFDTVKSLYVSKELWPQLGRSLRIWREVAREVLPELRTLFLEGSQPPGSARRSIKSFIALRQLSDRPITIQRCTARDFDPRD